MRRFPSRWRTPIVGAALLWLGLVSALRAETLYAVVTLRPNNEVPPVANLNASGGALVTLEITRDNAGAITAARMSFIVSVAFPGNVTVVGLHIHEADSLNNGTVRFDSGMSSSNAQSFENGAGLIIRDATTVDLTVLRRLLAHPAGFYVNLHTTVNPSGALRGQLTRFTESLARTIPLSPAQEAPPIAGLNATGTATITVNPARDAQGAVTGGSVNFTVAYDFPSAVVIRGLRIYEAPAGANGITRIDSGLSPANTINAATGKGFFSHTVLVTEPLGVAALARMLANPAGFYVNLLTAANPGGALRGQLDESFAAAPAIVQASAYALTTGTTAASINLLAVNVDLTSAPLINGQLAQYSFDFNTGQITVQIPADLRAMSGTLALQIRSGMGLLSPAVFVSVQASEGPAAVVDAAGYGASVAPESIAAAFGNGLATRPTGTTGAGLPSTLDGTTVYEIGRASCRERVCMLV